MVDLQDSFEFKTLKAPDMEIFIFGLSHYACFHFVSEGSAVSVFLLELYLCLSRRISNLKAPTRPLFLVLKSQFGCFEEE